MGYSKELAACLQAINHWSSAARRWDTAAAHDVDSMTQVANDRGHVSGDKDHARCQLMDMSRQVRQLTG
jgi:hypothetical protein